MKHVFNFKMQVAPLTSHTPKFKDMFTCFAGREPRCSGSCREKDPPVPAASQLQSQPEEFLLSLAPSSPKQRQGLPVHVQQQHSGVSTLRAGAMPRTAMDKSCKFRCLHCK